MTNAGPARITVQRRVEWSDTDAAGHQHFTAVLRWVEEAELLMHERLGIAELTVGRCPRVRVEADFTRRLAPQQLVEVELSVAHVGRSSISYRFEVSHCGELAARGIVVAALVAPGAGAVGWPEDARDTLLGGGAVRGEHYAS